MTGILTAEQKDAMARSRSWWLARQASTQQADRETAEAGVRQAYLASGLAAPDRIEWCAGPRELAQRWRAEMKPVAGTGKAIDISRIGANIRRELFDTMFSRTVSAAIRRAPMRIDMLVSRLALYTKLPGVGCLKHVGSEGFGGAPRTPS